MKNTVEVFDSIDFRANDLFFAYQFLIRLDPSLNFCHAHVRPGPFRAYRDNNCIVAFFAKPKVKIKRKVIQCLN